MNSIWTFFNNTTQKFTEIQEKSNDVSTLCNRINEPQINAISQYKFNFERLSILQEKFAKLIGIPETINDKMTIQYYQHLVDYLKDVCFENSYDDCYNLYNYQSDIQYGHLAALTQEKLYNFIRKNVGMNHWFFPYLCNCGRCFHLELNETAVDYCGEFDIQIIDILIEEIRQYLETIVEKRQRGSFSNVALPNQNPLNESINGSVRGSMRGSQRNSQPQPCESLSSSSRGSVRRSASRNN